MQPSSTAKAAAVLVFTSGVENFDQAVAIYDALDASLESVSDTLERFDGVTRWGEVDHLDGEEWWNEIWMLADTIDQSAQHFQQRNAA